MTLTRREFVTGGALSLALLALPPDAFRVFLPLVARQTPRHPKRGVAATYWRARDVRAVGAGWYYTWSPTPPLMAGAEAVPMIWGRFEGCPTLGGNSDYLLGFNEPDEEMQANLTTREGARLWRQLEQCYPERKLVSPAMAFDLGWLERMVQRYREMYHATPRFDALAFHGYRWADWYDGMRRDADRLWAWREEWGVPEGLWLTEFGNHWLAVPEQAREMQRVLDWLNTDERVDRYAWFATRYEATEWFAPGWNTQLIDWQTDELTLLGEVYAR